MSTVAVDMFPGRQMFAAKLLQQELIYEAILSASQHYHAGSG